MVQGGECEAIARFAVKIYSGHELSIGGFIWRNAVRNKRRFALTVSSVALSILLLTVLQVILEGLTAPKATEQSALRIVVRHSVSLANMLPAKYKERIERLPGVTHCSRMLWFGGIYQDERNFFPQFACDPQEVFKVLSEAVIDPQQLQGFIAERTACVVGIKTLQRFGWKLGDRVTLMGAMWPCNVELTIRGVYSGSLDESNLFFHHAYFDELLGDKGFTGLFWVRADSAESVPRLMQEIDTEFANSDAETITETEKSFQLGFVSMLGNLRMLIRSISCVIIFTLLLVTLATMSMAIRERTKEIAILKSIGFGAKKIFGFILAESFGLSLLGALLGVAGAVLLVHGIDFYGLSRGLFVSFAVSPSMVLQSLVIAAGLGVVSGLAPAWRSIRTRVVDALRTTD